MPETRFLAIYDLNLDTIMIYDLTVTTSELFAVAGSSKLLDLCMKISRSLLLLLDIA